MSTVFIIVVPFPKCRKNNIFLKDANSDKI